MVALSLPIATAQVQSADVKNFPEPAKRWALVVGVDQYDDPEISPNLGAVNDARAIADALVRYAGFPKDQVAVLTTDQVIDRQPTRTQILKRLTALRGSSGNTGLVLFAFAGHGIQVGDQAYLLPSDATYVPEDTHVLQDTAISMTTLHEYLRRTQQPQIITLFDACRNTPVERGARAQQAMGEPYQLSFDLENDGVVAFATLYATEKGSKSFEDLKQKQGYFSEVFVDALKGKQGSTNKTGLVTLSTLIDYLQTNVPLRVSRDLPGAVQRPYAVVEGFKAQELVLAGKEPPPPDDPKTWENPRDGLTYVLIPAGSFRFGCAGLSDKNCYRDEKPSRQLKVQPFRIGQTEVTVAAYRRFAEDNQWGISLPPPPHFNAKWKDPAQPITKVTWQEADRYCKWVGGRLPTETEWEYAARGGLDGLQFPWGNEVNHDNANYGDDKCCNGLAMPGTRDRWKYMAPISSFPANGYRLYDMAGNAAEWVEDSYQSYAVGSDGTRKRIVKGGSWLSTPDELRVSSRLPMAENNVVDDVGFRCVLPTSEK